MKSVHYWIFFILAFAIDLHVICMYTYMYMKYNTGNLYIWSLIYTIPGVQLSTLNECDNKHNHYYDEHILHVHIRVIVNIEITFNSLSEDVVHDCYRQWCGNSQSCRTLTDKSRECPVNCN